MARRTKQYGRKRKSTRSRRSSKRNARRPKKRSTIARVGKTLLRHARTFANDSALEAAVRKISKQECGQTNLIHRAYILADYRMDTNQMDWQTATPISWDGLSIPLCDIQKWDNETQALLTSQPQVPNTLFRPQDDTNMLTQNVIAPVITHNGFRQGLEIHVRNVALGLRIRVPPLVQDRDPQTGSIVNLAQYEHAFVKWAVVATQRQENDLLNYTVNPREVLPMRKFGYSSRLDRAEAVQVTDNKFKTLMKGTIKVNYQQWKVNETCIEKFRQGLNLKINYENDDLFGQKLHNSRYKLFLVMRSNIPSVGPYTQFLPMAAGYFKVGYRDL